MKCMFCRGVFEPEEMYAENICKPCNTKLRDRETIVAVADVQPQNLVSAVPEAEDETASPEVQAEYPYTITWKKYAVFEGRAARTEFWSFVMINIAIQFLLNAIGARPFALIFWCVTLVPTVAVSVRRLHDSNLSGGILFGILGIFISGGVVTAISMGSNYKVMNYVGMVLYLSALALWWWLMLRGSQYGSNKYGPNPYDMDA